MRIPAKFQLLGRTITVKDDARLQQDRGWCGSADYVLDQISMLPRSDFYQASEAKIEQTFCHELAHQLLYYAGAAVNHDLKSDGYIHKNEEFVDLLGSLIHQAFSTMEYDDQPKLSGDSKA